VDERNQDAEGACRSLSDPAAIAAIHDEAARFEETDWPQILAFYQLLERLSNNPIVSLNRIVAMAMVEGPKAGMARSTC
jgi:predicted RNA polymerase sigma factor